MKTDNQASPYDKLPNELFLHIAKFFSTNTLIEAALVSKTWHKKFTDDYIWDNQLASFQDKIVRKYGFAWPDIPPKLLKNQLPCYRILAQLRIRERNKQRLFFNCFSIGNPQHLACWYAKLDDNEELSTDAYTHILNLAASFGNLTLVKWLVNEKQVEFKPTDKTIANALRTGNQALVEWLINNHHLKPITWHLSEATKSGNLALVQWLINEHHVSTEGGMMRFTLHGAAYSGNLALVQWLEAEKQIAIDDNLIDSAAGSGNIDLVKWLFEVKNIRPRNHAIESAAASGNINLIKLLINKYGFRLTNSTLERAIESGNIELIRWLVDEQHLNIYSINLNHVAELGVYSAVKWVIDKEFEIPTVFTLDYAAKSGNIALVIWLIEVKKIAPNGSVLYRAIESANLTLIKYLINEKSLELDPYARNIAAVTSDPAAIELVETYLDAQEESGSETVENSATRQFTYN